MAASGSREGGSDAGRTDMAWQYCTAIDGDRKKTQCKFCGKKLMSGGITRLKQHLSGTSTDVAKCPIVPVEITRAIAAQMKGGQQRRAEKEKNKQQFEEAIRGTVRGLDDDSSDDDGLDTRGLTEEEARDLRRATMASKVSHDMEMERLRQRALGAGGSRSFQQPEEPQTRSKGGLASMFRRSKSTRAQPQAPPPTARDEDYVEILQQDPAVFRKAGAKQKRLKSMWNWKGTKEFIGDAFARWSIYNSIPANASGGPYYQPFFDAVAQAGPGVKAPTPYEVMNVYLPRIKKELEVWIEGLKNNWGAYGVTIMCDGWTGPTRKSIINFMVYSDGKTSFLKSVDASAYTKDANYIYGLLQTVVDEVGATNVVQIVTDNGSNYKKAGEMMMANYNLFWTPCAAHCIDLMLKDMGKIQKVKQVVEQARQVTTFVYNHGYSLNLLREKCGGDLVRPGITRFATNYIALKSFQAKMVGLRSMFASEDWFGWRESSSSAGVQAQTTIASEEFWRTLKDVVKILEPVVKVLRLVDTAFQPTMPHLYAAMDMLKDRIKTVLPRGNKHFVKIIKDRWESQLMHPLHKAAYYLNPKYQYSHVLGLNSDLIGAVKDVVAKLVPDYTVQALVNLEMKTFRDALGSFGTPAAVAGRDKTDPAEWWLLYGEHAAELRRIAIKVLSQTCSASGCERNWSTFSLIHSKRRNKLGSQRLNDLVYAHYNMRLRVQCLKFEQRNEQELIELADVFQLSSDEEDPYVEWVRDRAVPVMDEPSGMPDPTVSAPMGSNLERFMSSDEGRVHAQSPRPFDPPAGTGSDSEGDDDTMDQSGWSTSDSSGDDGSGGGDEGGGGDPRPTVPIIRWTGESQYTHATQDPDHGGRASSSRPMTGYTRRSRQRERPLQPVEEEEDRFFDIVPDPDIMPDVEIDSMSTSFGGLSIEGSSGQEQGQWSAHGFGTTSAYGSYSGDDDRMMGSAYDYSADTSNATSQTGSNFVDSLFSVPNLQRTTPPHQPIYAHFTPHYSELYPRLGIFRNFSDHMYEKYVEDYQTFYSRRMSWQDFVYQTEIYFLQQSQSDQMEPARHSTYD